MSHEGEPEDRALPSDNEETVEEPTTMSFSPAAAEPLSFERPLPPGTQLPHPQQLDDGQHPTHNTGNNISSESNISVDASSSSRQSLESLAMAAFLGQQPTTGLDQQLFAQPQPGLHASSHNIPPLLSQFQRSLLLQQQLQLRLIQESTQLQTPHLAILAGLAREPQDLGQQFANPLLPSSPGTQAQGLSSRTNAPSRNNVLYQYSLNQPAMSIHAHGSSMDSSRQPGTMNHSLGSLPMQLQGSMAQGYGDTVGQDSMIGSARVAEREYQPDIDDDDLGPEPKKPSRPLSAYNYFFKHHRQLMLGQHGLLPIDSKRSNQPTLAEDCKPKAEGYQGPQHKRAGRGNATKDGPSRKKPTVGFETMAKKIGFKWKNCRKEEKKVFQDMADQDKMRYESQLQGYKQWKERKMLAQLQKLEGTVSSSVRQTYLASRGTIVNRHLSNAGGGGSGQTSTPSFTSSSPQDVDNLGPSESSSDE